MIALSIFIAAAAFVIWVLFGYPLVLSWIARTPRPVRKTFRYRSVSILLPVANGEAWIRAKLENLFSLDYPRECLEIIVVSDGSVDNTESIVAEYADRGVKLISIPSSGKAVALNHAMSAARGQILFFNDVRQALEPQCLRHLVACLEDPNVGAATGELMIRRGASTEEANVGLYWRYEKWIRKHLSAVDSILGSTGCIYAIRRELATQLPPGTLLDDVYIPLHAFFAGYRIVVDEKARAYDNPTSLNTEFRRKVRTQAGVFQIIASYPQLLSARNRMWIHFISHKLGRLLLPYALLALLISSFWMDPPLSTIAVTFQAAFYGLALLDRWIPERVWIKRFSSITRAFVTLVAAAFCGISILFVDPQRLWKRPSPSTTVRSTSF